MAYSITDQEDFDLAEQYRNELRTLVTLSNSAGAYGAKLKAGWDAYNALVGQGGELEAVSTELKPILWGTITDQDIASVQTSLDAFLAALAVLKSKKPDVFG